MAEVALNGHRVSPAGHEETGAGGLLIRETLAAGLTHGGLYFGSRRNVGQAVDRAASELDIDVAVLD